MKRFAHHKRAKDKNRVMMGFAISENIRNWIIRTAEAQELTYAEVVENALLDGLPVDTQLDA